MDDVPVPGLFVRWSPRRIPGHLLLRQELSMAFGVAESAVDVIGMCGRCGSTTHGAPRLRNWPHQTPPYVSVARCDDMTVVGWTLAGPVGVDVEHRRAADFDGFTGVLLHPAERSSGAEQATRTWVRKESLLKATGHGLGVDPAKIRLSEPGEPAALLSWDAADSPTTAAWLYDVDTGTDHAVAVTVLAPDRPELTT